MPITTDELKAGLANLAATDPGAIADVFASTLGLNRAALGAIVKVGSDATKREDARAILGRLEARSAELLQTDRAAVEDARATHVAPLEVALNRRSTNHANTLGRVRAIVAEIEAGTNSVLPDEAAFKAELEA